VSLLKNIKSSTSKEGVRLNSIVITFFIVIRVSIFFWLLMALTKEYGMAVNFPVTYVNLPKDKVIANQLPEMVNIEIRSSGFNLMMYKLRRHRKAILIDVQGAKPLRSKNHFYLSTHSSIAKITEQFNNHIKVMRINPDTIFFNFNKKVTKTVPVKANVTLNFDSQYQQTDSIQLRPAFIDISGAADIINKIDHVETVPANFKNIDKPLSLKLTILRSSGLKQVELSQSAVLAVVNFKKNTEAGI